jgi:hypothetical protein
MKITYEIKSIEELKKLPLLCKIGLLIFYLGVISFVSCFVLDFLKINLLKQVSENFPLYSIGLSILGILMTIFFDKGRKKRTKVGPLNGG